MKHKHCDVIKAWADGNRIEWREGPSGSWKDLIFSNMSATPSFDPHYEFRVKPKEPKGIWYRPYQYTDGVSCGTASEECYVQTVTASISSWSDFVKWLDDWKFIPTP